MRVCIHGHSLPGLVFGDAQSGNCYERVLELAFSYNAPEHRAFLDLRTGGVLILPLQALRNDVLRNLAGDPSCLVPINPVLPGDQYRWMVEFSASIQDGELRACLERVLSAPGVFREFKSILYASTKEWRRWRAARAARLQERILAWLAEKDLTPDELPPWQVTGSVDFERNEAYDRLRRIAHDRIEKLSPAGLELTLVYLRDVHERHG